MKHGISQMEAAYIIVYSHDSMFLMIIIELLEIQGTILEAQPAFNLPELTVTSFPGEGSRRGSRGFVSRFLPSFTVPLSVLMLLKRGWQ